VPELAAKLGDPQTTRRALAKIDLELACAVRRALPAEQVAKLPKRPAPS